MSAVSACHFICTPWPICGVNMKTSVKGDQFWGLSHLFLLLGWRVRNPDEAKETIERVFEALAVNYIRNIHKRRYPWFFCGIALHHLFGIITWYYTYVMYTVIMIFIQKSKGFLAAVKKKHPPRWRDDLNLGYPETPEETSRKPKNKTKHRFRGFFLGGDGNLTEIRNLHIYIYTCT